VLPPHGPGDRGRCACAAAAANLDGFVSQGSYLAGEVEELKAQLAQFEESQRWNEKLQRDIAALKAEIERLAEANRELTEYKAAFDQLPRPLRGLLRKVWRARS
jgi:predicted RNase H-like nuclease (RuvC/YqgF family)